MPIYNSRIQKKSNKLLYIFVIIIFVIIYLFVTSFFSRSIYIKKNIYIGEGDNISKLYNDFSTLDKFLFKYYLKKHKQDLETLQVGNYVFSGSYTPLEIIKLFNKGPISKYLSLTILEGWSKYDIDFALTNKGYIKKGDYISFVDNKDIIVKYQKRYGFLNNDKINSLEGYLYPDTYFVDPNKNILDQLVYLQLETFNIKIWKKYSDDISTFANRLKKTYSKLSLDFYDLMVLASIVEKEERNKNNMKYIGGIFLNRLQNNIRLDADISLCYGLKLSYNECTPSLIVKNIDDKSNLYNTRSNNGLPPTPIGNPTENAIDSILNFEKNDYFYYLHDNQGEIHLSKDIQEHNFVKSKYLNN